MALVYVANAETGDFGQVAFADAGWSVVSAPVASGDYAYEGTGNDAGLFPAYGLSLSRAYSTRMFRFDTVAAPSVLSELILAVNFDVDYTAQCYLIFRRNTNNTNSLILYDKDASLIQLVTTNITVNVWHRIEIDFTVGAGTGAITVRVDGALVISQVNQQFGSNKFVNDGVGFATGDWAGRKFWFDDIEIDDGLPNNNPVIVVEPQTIATMEICLDEDWRDPLPLLVDDGAPLNLRRLELHIRPDFDSPLLLARLTSAHGGIVIDSQGLATISMERPEVVRTFPSGRWAQFLLLVEPSDDLDGFAYREIWRGPFIVHPARTDLFALDFSDPDNSQYLPLIGLLGA